MSRRLSWPRHLLSALLLCFASSAPANSGVSRVIYHLNDGSPKQQFVLLRNISNHFDASPPGTLEIRVLVHGEGIALLLLPEAGKQIADLKPNATPKNRKELDQLRQRGVQFVVSEATLNYYNIDAGRQLYRVRPQDIVPNGLAYLSELHSQGFTYIKP